MSINILFFGELADVAQRCTGNTTLEIPMSESGNSLHQLQETISGRHTELAEIFARGDHLCSVNQVIHQKDHDLKDGDEVAFMSPFSGG